MNFRSKIIETFFQILLFSGREFIKNLAEILRVFIFNFYKYFRQFTNSIYLVKWTVIIQVFHFKAIIFIPRFVINSIFLVLIINDNFFLVKIFLFLICFYKLHGSCECFFDQTTHGNNLWKFGFWKRKNSHAVQNEVFFLVNILKKLKIAKNVINNLVKNLKFFKEL